MIFDRLEISAYTKDISAGFGIVVLVIDTRCQATDIDFGVRPTIFGDDKQVISRGIQPDPFDTLCMRLDGITKRKVIQTQIGTILQEAVRDRAGVQRGRCGTGGAALDRRAGDPRRQGGAPLAG